MTRAEANALATAQVLGKLAEEYATAVAAKESGALEKEQFEPVKHAYENALKRRRDQINEAADALLADPAPAKECEAWLVIRAGAPDPAQETRLFGTKLAKRCAQPASTVIGKRWYCDACARLVPRRTRERVA